MIAIGDRVEHVPSRYKDSRRCGTVTEFGYSNGKAHVVWENERPPSWIGTGKLLRVDRNGAFLPEGIKDNELALLRALAKAVGKLYASGDRKQLAVSLAANLSFSHRLRAIEEVFCIYEELHPLPQLRPDDV